MPDGVQIRISITMQKFISDRPVSKYQRIGLWALLVFFIFFGGIVEMRSVYLKYRRTDADDFFRAAWGIRTGQDIYDLIDTEGWHYNYPPFFAIITAPLANPPPDVIGKIDPGSIAVNASDGVKTWLITPKTKIDFKGSPAGLAGFKPGMIVVVSAGETPLTAGHIMADNPDRTGFLPYGLSIAIWYALSVIALVLAMHWLANTIEGCFTGPLSKRSPPGCLRWWALRVIPILVCLPSIGRTLSRGQVNLFVVLLFCGIGILVAKKRNGLAGACIAIAASIKIFPAYLGLYALLRRDWRCVAGCLAGAFFCLVLVPLAALGPHQTETCYRKYFNVLLGPALTGGGDQSRAEELLNATGTDSQSFLTIIHNTMHPWQPRPPHAAPWVRPVHWILSFLITAITLWFGRRARPADGIYNILFLGTLIVAMLPISPVSHTHYFVFALPLVMALTAYSWERNQAPCLGRGYVILFTVHILANVLSLPQSDFGMLMRSLGLSLYGTMILWVAGIAALRQRGRTPEPRADEKLKLQPVSV